MLLCGAPSREFDCCHEMTGDDHGQLVLICPLLFRPYEAIWLGPVTISVDMKVRV